MTSVRWWMLALLFFATTINYLDRIVLSVLSPVILGEMHISKQQYGDITSAFQLTYTFGFIFFGWFIDRFGTRVGYAVSALWWGRYEYYEYYESCIWHVGTCWMWFVAHIEFFKYGERGSRVNRLADSYDRGDQHK